MKNKLRTVALIMSLILMMTGSHVFADELTQEALIPAPEDLQEASVPVPENSEEALESVPEDAAVLEEDIPGASMISKEEDSSGVSVSDEEETLGASAVLLSGYCGEEADFVLYEDGTLVVSGNGAMYNWDPLLSAEWNEYLFGGDKYLQTDYFGYRNEDEIYLDVFDRFPIPWEDYKDKIKRVEIKEGITTVGAATFEDCENLTEVILPEGLLYIRDEAFCGCLSLARIDFPDSLKAICPYAFCQCGSLYFDSLSSSLVALGKDAFSECKALPAVTLPGSLVYIEESFDSCDSLMAVIVEEGITKLPEYMFFACGALEYVYLPKSLLSANDPFVFCDIRYVYFGGSEAEFSSLKKKKTISGIEDADILYDQEVPPLYVVELDYDGGFLIINKDEVVQIIPKRYAVFDGGMVWAPEEDPDKEGFVFCGWYEIGADEAFDFENEEIHKNTFIKAKWNEPQPIDVTFMSVGKVYQTVTILQKEMVDKPEDPENEGYVLFGWYIDEACTEKFDFNTPLLENITLYAYWVDETLAGHHKEKYYAYGISGPLMSVEFDYTDRVRYDGRKHVWVSQNAAPNEKVSPDIRVENLTVSYCGLEVPGIKIAKVKCKNNVRPYYYSYDIHDYVMMTLDLKLAYDKNDPVLATIMQKDKKFKKRLDLMVAPKKKMVRVDGEKQCLWSYDPIEVKINPFKVTVSTPVYTTSQYDSDPELKQADGILIYDGTTSRAWKTYTVDGYVSKACVKAEAKGLRIQKKIDYGNGKIVYKQFPLKCGVWKIKVTGRRGEQTYEYQSPKKADYCAETRMTENDGVFIIKTVTGGIISGTIPTIPLSN